MFHFDTHDFLPPSPLPLPTPAVDGEAALASYKEKVLPSAPGGKVGPAEVKALFLALGYDKVTGPPPPAPAEGGAEGGEAAAPSGDGEEKKEEGAEGQEGSASAPAPAPAVETKTSDYGEQVFALLDASKSGSLHIAQVLGTIQVCKAGFGEPALRFALKAAGAASSAETSLKEAEVFTAITVAANRELTPIVRNHLRRAWRAAEKFQPPAPEGAEGGGEEGAPPPAAPVVAPEDTAVIVDDFVAKVSEDEALSAALVKEVPVPIEAPPAEATAEE